jgi:hypothetical protein
MKISDGDADSRERMNTFFVVLTGTRHGIAEGDFSKLFAINNGVPLATLDTSRSSSLHHSSSVQTSTQEA